MHTRSESSVRQAAQIVSTSVALPSAKQTYYLYSTL